MMIMSAVLPQWVQKLIIGAIITLSLGGGATWLTHISTETSTNTKDIVELRTQERSTHDEILRMEGKIDDLDAYLRDRDRERHEPQTRIIYRDHPVYSRQYAPTKQDVLNGMLPPRDKTVAQ